MRIPSKAECFSIMFEMEMLEHIAAHSVTVCRVALLMADLLSDRGVMLRRDLVRTASLLHDITKTRSFTTGENHALSGDMFLRERGYAEVGSIVGQHVRLTAYSDTCTPTEAEIVNYADKRVLHDQVVTLDARMTYILERYGRSMGLEQKLLWLWEKTRELEVKLFGYMSLAPEALDRHVDVQKVGTDLLEYRRACEQDRRNLTLRETGFPR